MFDCNETFRYLKRFSPAHEQLCAPSEDPKSLASVDWNPQARVFLKIFSTPPLSPPVLTTGPSVADLDNKPTGSEQRTYWNTRLCLLA
jgi:hypothetical protein